MGSDHFPIHILLDKPFKRNTPLTQSRYRFHKTDDDFLHNTLKDSLNSINTDTTIQDKLEDLAVTFCEKLIKAVNTSTPKAYSRKDPRSPISQAISFNLNLYGGRWASLPLGSFLLQFKNGWRWIAETLVTLIVSLLHIIWYTFRSPGT